MLNYKRVHFIGIGGIGMSGIARLLLSLGFEVTGSDLKRSEITRALEKEGARIYYGHHPHHVEGAEVVVYSSAIRADNPELRRAQELGLRVVPRAQMLVEIMALHRYNIAVAGAHGKTTTSSMIASVLTNAGLRPTVAVGGKVNGFNENAWLGQRDYLVAEADESDGSFLRMTPTVAVVTNIDAEHLDFYEDLEAVKGAFYNFFERVRPDGLLVICLDDPHLQDLYRQGLPRRVITYGFHPEAEVRGHILEEGPTAIFEVSHAGRYLGEVQLAIPGRHNVQNALAAVAVGLELGLPFEEIACGLANFTGVRRRLEIKGDTGEVLIIDDYAHHPTEIKTTIAALKATYPERRLVILFQPHRYTRTKALFEDFVRAFDEADVLLITEIYPAAETPIPGVTGERLYAALKKRRGKETYFAETKEVLLARALHLLAPGDVVVTMGAGDVYRVAEALTEELGAREREEVA
ncbi:MAG: UDP-N-acetylmuramate--L-alanine ligase [Thermodesulfobacteria bacterium]|nr:UDP-N-acetylmuramate--L-alanine ligase [Thermodesulfobacteriota bacterium]